MVIASSFYKLTKSRMVKFNECILHTGNYRLKLADPILATHCQAHTTKNNFEQDSRILHMQHTQQKK